MPVLSRSRTVSPSLLYSGLLATTMLTAPALAADQSGLEIVTVTAEKRVETLQKVPMQVQALTSEKLTQLHLKDFTDFALYMPNVTYAVSGQGSSGGPGFSNVTMRGIASDENGNHSGPQPPVGVYFDEQPITTINGTLDIPTYDIARVEALSGPQGTLYGASSESGTIRIISNKPDASGFAASYDADVNSVDHGGVGYGGHGMVNLPIADNAALRIVAWDEHDAGYIDNVPGSLTYTFPGIAPDYTINNASAVKKNYNTVDKLGARAALQIDLNDNWTITPTIMAQTEREEGVFGYDPKVGMLEVTHFLPEYSRDKWYQAALTVEGKISDLDLVYSGGYMNRRVHSSADYADYTYYYDQTYPSYEYLTDNSGNQIDPTQQVLGNDFFTKQNHELRISTDKDARFRVVAGAFYQKQTHHIVQDYFIPGMADASSVPGWPGTIWLTDQIRTDQDKALFGEAAFDITPDLTLTGGIRFYQFDNSLVGFFGLGSYVAPVGVGSGHCIGPTIVKGTPCTDLNADSKGNGETHKANLTWKVTDDKLVYATYSTGFRPGGANRVYNPATNAPYPPYPSDSLTNYEIGWKTSWDDDRVRFNGAFYVEDWKSFQFPFLGPNSVTIIFDGGQARVKGAEFDLQWLPIDSLTLTANGAYNDAVLTSNYCGVAGVSVCPGPLAPDPPQAPTGTQLPITPKWKVNGTARYEWPMGDFTAHVQGSVVHQSGTWADLRVAERTELGENKAFTTADFTTGVEKDTWSLELYVKNVFDDKSQLGRYPECAIGICGGRPYILVAQPRTVGLTFSQKFD